MRSQAEKKNLALANTHDPIKPDSTQVLRHFRSILEEKKREVYTRYAEIKLQLPRYIKNETINSIRGARGSIDLNHIHIPKETDEFLRKRAALDEKFRDIVIQHTAHVREYYKTIRKQLPEHLLKKQILSLTDDELTQIGIDPRKILRRDQLNSIE